MDLERQLEARVNPLKEMETVKVLIGRCVSTDAPMRYIVQSLSLLRALHHDMTTATLGEADLKSIKDIYVKQQRAIIACAINIRHHFNHGTRSSHQQDTPLTVAGFQWFEDLLRTFYIRQERNQWVTMKEIINALDLEPMFLAAIQNYFGLRRHHRSAEAKKILTEFLLRIGTDELRTVKIKLQ